MNYFKRRKFIRWVILGLFLLGCWSLFHRVTILNNVYGLLNINQPTAIKVTPKNQLSKLLARPQTAQTVQPLNNNQPSFSKKDLTISNKQGWQHLSQLDWLGRPQVANALLNKSLMPTKQRLTLTITPPGYQVFTDSQGDYLYNRSHLIGYQLTGENNNSQNLITGTRQLNANYPGNPSSSMETYENEVAQYLKNNKHHYVRYEVSPIYQNVERVPRGVEMQGESIHSKQIKFNVFIPNVQQGWQIDYFTGHATQTNQ